VMLWLIGLAMDLLPPIRDLVETYGVVSCVTDSVSIILGGRCMYRVEMWYLRLGPERKVKAQVR
jgi:hypothetical protein